MMGRQKAAPFNHFKCLLICLYTLIVPTKIYGLYPELIK